GEIAISRISEQPRLQYHLGEFLDKQGNSIGLADDCLEHFGWQFLAAGEIVDHCSGFVAPESIDVNHGDVRLSEPRWGKLGPKGDQEQYRSRFDRFHKQSGRF